MDRTFTVIDRIIDNLGDDVHRKHRYRNWEGIGHRRGTTRMSLDPTEGPVNPKYRTNDLENLYVALSSVFRHAGELQPTLTILHSPSGWPTISRTNSDEPRATSSFTE